MPRKGIKDLCELLETSIQIQRDISASLQQIAKDNSRGNSEFRQFKLELARLLLRDLEPDALDTNARRTSSSHPTVTINTSPRTRIEKYSDSGDDQDCEELSSEDEYQSDAVNGKRARTASFSKRARRRTTGVVTDSAPSTNSSLLPRARTVGLPKEQQEEENEVELAAKRESSFPNLNFKTLLYNASTSQATDKLRKPKFVVVGKNFYEIFRDSPVGETLIYEQPFTLSKHRIFCANEHERDIIAEREQKDVTGRITKGQRIQALLAYFLTQQSPTRYCPESPTVKQLLIEVRATCRAVDAHLVNEIMKTQKLSLSKASAMRLGECPLDIRDKYIGYLERALFNKHNLEMTRCRHMWAARLLLSMAVTVRTDKRARQTTHEYITGHIDSCKNDCLVEENGTGITHNFTSPTQKAEDNSSAAESSATAAARRSSPAQQSSPRPSVTTTAAAESSSISPYKSKTIPAVIPADDDSSNNEETDNEFVDAIKQISCDQRIQAIFQESEQEKENRGQDKAKEKEKEILVATKERNDELEARLLQMLSNPAQSNQQQSHDYNLDETMDVMLSVEPYYHHDTFIGYINTKTSTETNTNQDSVQQQPPFKIFANNNNTK